MTDKPNSRQAKDERPVLTTRQGHPVRDNQALHSVGERGPATLENYQFIEKITHFDRERIPQRVVHARGAGAHGWFEAYGRIGNEPAGKYTRARVLNETGVKTPVFVRFSTVIGGKDSPETARDPRLRRQAEDRRPAVRWTITARRASATVRSRTGNATTW